MNEVRELNVAEMAQVEGGDHLEEFFEVLLSGLESLFSGIFAESLGALITGTAEIFFDFLASLFSGLDS